MTTHIILLQDDARLEQEQATAPSSTWLPYTLIDQVLAAADSEALSPHGQSLRQELRSEVANRIKRLRTLSLQAP